MGYSVNCNDELIWGPSLRTGQYFLTNIEALEKLVGKESGIVSYMADDIEINYTKLKSFIDEVLGEFEKSKNTPLLAMMSGIVELLLALEANILGDFTRKGNGPTLALIERSKLVFGKSEGFLARA